MFKLPTRKAYNWRLLWRAHRVIIAALTLQFAAFMVLGHIFHADESRIAVGKPIKTTPLAEKIAVHDAEFEKAMLEIIARDTRMEKEHEQ